MAFTNVTPDWKISAQADLDFSSLRVTWRSTRHFTCLRSDSSNDTPTRARQQGVFGFVGDPDPDDPIMFLKSLEIKELGLSALESTNQYESLPQEIDVAVQQQIIAGWEFEFDSESSEEDIDWARDVFPREGRTFDEERGVPITTIVNEPYDPKLKDTVHDLAFGFSTTNRPFRPEILWLYRNAVNSDTFLNLFPRGTCRMRQCRGTKAISSDNTIRWNVNCRVVIRDAAPGSTYERAWWIRTLANGLYVNTLEGQKKVRAYDVDGEPVVKPVLHYTTGANKGIQIYGDDAHELAEFYEFQPPSLVYRPFNQFFQAIVAA